MLLAHLVLEAVPVLAHRSTKAALVVAIMNFIHVDGKVVPPHKGQGAQLAIEVPFDVHPFGVRPHVALQLVLPRQNLVADVKDQQKCDLRS